MVSEEAVEAARFRGTDTAKVSPSHGDSTTAPRDQCGQSTLCIVSRGGGLWKRDLEDEFFFKPKGCLGVTTGQRLLNVIQSCRFAHGELRAGPQPWAAGPCPEAAGAPRPLLAEHPLFLLTPSVPPSKDRVAQALLLRGGGRPVTPEGLRKQPKHLAGLYF